MAFQEPSITSHEAITGGGAFTPTVWNRTFLVDSTAAATSVTLPTPANFPDQVVEVRKTDTSTNAVTVALTAGTINGVASIILTNQNDSIVLRNDGTNAVITSDNRDRDQVQSVSANTTLTTWQQTIFVDATAGAITITLPSATVVDATGNPPKGGRIIVKKTDASANYVTVAPAAAQTIDARATYVLQQQNESVGIESDGTANTRVAAQYRPAPLTVTGIKSGAYTTTYGELVRVDVSGGGFTVTLPTLTAAIPGVKIGFKHTTTNATNSLTVAAAAANTIDGAATFVMTGPRFEFELTSNGGTDWMVG